MPGRSVKRNYYIETYGCALAQFESIAMSELLDRAGFASVSSPEEADIIIVNTCAVRLDTEQRIVERLEKLRKQLPGKKYIIAGCLAKTRPGLIKRVVPDASLLAPQAVDRVVYAANTVEPVILLDVERKMDWFPTRLVDKRRGLVATIMVQEGCLNNCSYCITKLSRMGPRSFKPRVIVEAVKRAVEGGAVEIRLTGTDIAAYGVDLPGRPNLADLVTMILEKVEGDYRIRIGMMTPEQAIELGKDLIEAYRDDRIYKFFHIPVQTGDDNLLRIMGRKYTVRDFKELHRLIKRNYPESLFATDIIVGHPGEDEEAFNNTVKLVKELRFERVHLAQYSLRPHTRAASMKQVSDGVKKKRSKILSKVIEEITLEIHRSYVGKRVTGLLVERGFRENSIVARLDNYFPVVINDGMNLLGKWAIVEIEDSTFFDLRGKIISII
ncbi:MAG: tRNA (N(6)-L-threonylcarbamoyladenosine(37)-C(2))-methylthiotransferase [Desulfurococcales archaeon]|nr:tRNA (N(6)-L-threonylcarbamoyladenosine(37)-C(2))-methylthiotransferase [Desulfurococcales archaeon]MCE4629813.1 tRNA (N(6)-L-threonylcarbamoyladenosine(37)-C(2))-methylthiotransferase [Desulfurococcales archaeon]